MVLVLLILALLMPIDEPADSWRVVPQPAVLVQAPFQASGPVYAITKPWLSPDHAGYCPLVPGSGWTGTLAYPMPTHTEIQGAMVVEKEAEYYQTTDNDALNNLRGGLLRRPATTKIVGGKHFMETDYHRGVDFLAPVGTPVYASASGTVVWAGYYGAGWGNTVALSHGGGWVTVYAHLSSVAVSCGQGASGLIGYSGQSGLAARAHLHFEVRHGDISDPRAPMVYDPENYLRG